MCYQALYDFGRGPTLGSLEVEPLWPTNNLYRKQHSFNIEFLSEKNANEELDKERMRGLDYKPNVRRLLLVEEATLPRSFIRPFSLTRCSHSCKHPHLAASNTSHTIKFSYYYYRILHLNSSYQH